MKQQKKKKKLISWILLLSWMVFIFYMSQQTGQVSSGQSGKIVLLLSKIGIEISQDNISKITFIIRKSAHFSEYFILYILTYLLYHCNSLTIYFTKKASGLVPDALISIYLFYLYKLNFKFSYCSFSYLCC